MIKIKITLLNPRYKVWSPNLWAPIGLAYIAAALEQAGHKVNIIDINATKISDKELIKKVEKSDAIGIGGMITEYRKIINLANFIKEKLPDIPIILGGPCTTTLSSKILEKTKADYAVIGEGEVTFVNLIRAIEKGTPLKNIKGLVFRKGNKIIMTRPQEPIENLDEIPFPARHLLDMEKYIYDYLKTIGIRLDDYDKIRSTTMISSRGCPYRCTFCDKGMWGYKWRARSPQNIIDEITFLKEKYKVNCIWFNDDTFVIDKKRVEKFSKLMEGLDVTWFCHGRVNLMQSKDIFITMRKGNCRVMGFGIESGDQNVLDNMKKMITLEQTRKAIIYAKEADVKVGGFFILGMPGETRETIDKTLSFARELNLDYYAFSVATPYFGTEMFERAVKDGLIREEGYSDIYESDWIAGVTVNLTKNVSDVELREFQNKAFIDFVLKKQFGKFFFLHPFFLKEASKIILSIRNLSEAKKLGNKMFGLLKVNLKKEPA
ncbi:MAG: radical SAM protein [Asgard group archaeon]